MDLAPTVLRLFGIDEPAYMDGKALELKVPKVRSAKCERKKDKGKRKREKDKR